MVPGLILAVLVSVGTLRGPSLMSSDGIGSGLIVVAPLILATYALTAIVMAGRAGVDLSIGPLIGFINVGMIKLLEAGYLGSPISVFVYAIGVGVAYQLLLGLIIVYVRVQPIIVSLSGYLALVGLNLLILPRPGGVAPDWMTSWGSGTAIFTPILAIVVIATLGWYALARTAFFGHLRLMGSDERAAYTSGVRINVVRLGAHCIAGVYAGLAAICFTALIGSGDPTQGTTFTLMAITALVLGGASLSGGRGGATGSLLGSLNIYLISYVLATFNFGTVQSYVTDLSYGTMLVASLLTNSALPQIQRAVRSLSPTLFFAILLSIAGGVALHATIDAGADAGPAATALPSGAAVAGAALPAGSIIILVVIGLVAVGFLLALLIRQPRPAVVALVVVAGVIGLGVIFNGHDAGHAMSAAGPGAVDLSAYGLDMLSADGFVHRPATGSAAGPLSGVAFAVLPLLGVVMLVSVMVALNLFDAEAVRGAASRGVVLAGLVVAVLGLGALLVVRRFGDGGQTSLFGGEGLSLIAGAAVLFVLLWSPLPSRLKNVANLYIVLLGGLALGSLYFSAATPVQPTAMGRGVTGDDVRGAMVMRPAVMPSLTVARLPRVALAPSRSLPPVVALSYALVIGFALQAAVWLACRGRVSLRRAASLGYVVAGAILAWGSLFYFSGAAPLTLIGLTLVATVATAPLVWRALGSSARSFDRRDGLVEEFSGSLGGRRAKRGGRA